MMDAPAFDAKGFVRPALRVVVLYLSVIVISLTTMVTSANASGTVPAALSCSWTGYWYGSGGGFSSIADACAAVGAVPVGGGSLSATNCINPDIGAIYWYASCSVSCPGGSDPLNETTCTCNNPNVPDSTGTSCALPACPDHASRTTPGAACTCDVNYKFDAAGTSCVPDVVCSVDPLSKPPPPFSDACSNSLEKGRGVDINNACAAGLTPDMQDGVKCVSDKIHALAIPYTGPSATIRTEAYQNHLLIVWNKSEEIKNKDDWLPGEKQACATVIADVDDEMDWHVIDSTPSSSEDLAPHVMGRAIDIPKNVAKTLIAQVTNMAFVANCIVCLPLPVITGDVQDYVNSSRINPPACNLDWGGRFKKPRPDPVHFQLP